MEGKLWEEVFVYSQSMSILDAGVKINFKISKNLCHFYIHILNLHSFISLLSFPLIFSVLLEFLAHSWYSLSSDLLTFNLANTLWLVYTVYLQCKIIKSIIIPSKICPRFSVGMNRFVHIWFIHNKLFYTVCLYVPHFLSISSLSLSRHTLTPKFPYISIL